MRITHFFKDWRCLIPIILKSNVKSDLNLKTDILKRQIFTGGEPVKRNRKGRNFFYGFSSFLFLPSAIAMSSTQANCDSNTLTFNAETKHWLYRDNISAVSFLSKGKALLQIETEEVIFSFNFKVLMYQPGNSIFCQTNARISFEGLDKSGNLLWKTGIFDFQSSYLGEREFVFEKNIKKEILAKTFKIQTVFHCEKPDLEYRHDPSH